MNHHVMCIEYKQEWPGATVPMVALFDGRDLTEAEARALIREDAPSNKLVTMGKDQYMTVFRSLKEQPVAHGEAGEPEQHIASIVYDKHAGEYTITTRDAVTGRRQVTKANHLTDQEKLWARINCRSRNETPYTISWSNTGAAEE